MLLFLFIDADRGDQFLSVSSALYAPADAVSDLVSEVDLNLTADVIGDCETVCSFEAPIAADVESVLHSESAAGNRSIMPSTPAPVGPVSDHTVELLDESSSLTMFRSRSSVFSASISNCVDWVHVPVRILFMPKAALVSAEESRPLPSFCQLPISPTFQPVQGTFASPEALSRVPNFALHHFFEYSCNAAHSTH
jgi:hypothetical protein